MIKTQIQKDLIKAIKKATGSKPSEVYLEHPENPEHGDYACNWAMTNFSQTQKKRFKSPLELAQKIAAYFPKTDYLQKAEAIAPGFINFYLADEFLQNQVKKILKQKEAYGLNSATDFSNNKKMKIQVEFISANPTGPLHVGNCRGGFNGNTFANVLEKLGYQVEREYYINDRGTQIEKLGQSLKVRYEQLRGKKAEIPEGGYPGEYLKEIAKKISPGKKPKSFKKIALKEILKSIKKTTKRMGIKYDVWFSEDSLYCSGQTDKAISLLKNKGLIYSKEGAVWFRATKFRDEKDRVLIKSDGEATYLLSDLAYHLNKFKKRKFDKVILFWGADHHGYVPRFLGMIEAIGYKNQAEIELCQLLALQRGDKKVRMAKRTGDYLTVDDLLDEIGLDAARFYFLSQSLNRNMVLDLKMAAEKTINNPVYYIQYAHARICSILKKTKKTEKKVDFKLLNHPAELNLIRKIIQLPEILVEIEKNHQLQVLPFLAMKIADLFHKFYEQCRVLDNQNKELTGARLALVKASQLMLATTLKLMDIAAPEKM